MKFFITILSAALRRGKKKSPVMRGLSRDSEFEFSAFL
jgi:hypothetical protein